MDRKGILERGSIPREAVGERDEVLYTKEIYVRLRDEWYIRLVELVDTNRKRAMKGNVGAER